MKRNYLIIALITWTVAIIALHYMSCTHIITRQNVYEFVVNYPTNYEQDIFAVGKQIYIDRPYVFESVPLELQGYFYIRTANDDKFNSEKDFLSITLERRCHVVVLYDHRFDVPTWLSTWTKQADSVEVSDPNLGYFYVYQKNLVEGTYILGGNFGAGSMYVVLIKPYYEAFDFMSEIDFYTLKFFPISTDADTVIDETNVIELSWLPPLFRKVEDPFPPQAERIGEPFTFDIYNTDVNSR